MIRKGLLPNFLVIGAMKAGTTSLHVYLRQHPQVFVSDTKELHFFTKNWDRGPDWYRSQFAEANGALAIGESSTSYTRYPDYPDVPMRIASLILDVRLIYLVRDPTERMRSHYLHERAGGKERDPIARALLTNPKYMNTSRYALQLERYLECFSRDRILLVTNESLRSSRAATLRSVYQFLGADASFVPPNLDREFYRTADRRTLNPALRAVRAGLKPVTSKIPASVRHQVVRRLATRRVADDGSQMTDGLRLELEEMLRDDVRRLRTHMGKEFDGWGIA